jgi:hypothetical protein
MIIIIIITIIIIILIGVIKLQIKHNTQSKSLPAARSRNVLAIKTA